MHFYLVLSIECTPDGVGVKNWCHGRIEAGVFPCLPASYGHRSGVKNWCQRRIRRGERPVWRGYVLGLQYLHVLFGTDNQQDKDETYLGN